MPEQSIDVYDCLIVTEDPTLELYSARSVETSQRALTRGRVSCRFPFRKGQFRGLPHVAGSLSIIIPHFPASRSSTFNLFIHQPLLVVFYFLNIIVVKTTNVSVNIKDRLLSYCDGVTVCLFACLICLLAVTSSLQVCHDARQGRSGL